MIQYNKTHPWEKPCPCHAFHFCQFWLSWRGLFIHESKTPHNITTNISPQTTPDSIYTNLFTNFTNNVFITHLMFRLLRIALYWPLALFFLPWYLVNPMKSQHMAKLRMHFAETKPVSYDNTWVTVQLSRVACLSKTYSQVLRCEGPQASQVSPGGGAVELLNLLY